MKPERTRSSSALTAAGEDYLKAIWAAEEWGGPAATMTSLADRFGTSTANVSDVIRRLTAQGFILHERYGPILLTEAGERYAVRMVRRHRLIEAFLVEQLGYTWGEVHDEAERLEHAASDTMIDRIDAALGWPRFDPHGDPIPSGEGITHRPEGAVNLAEAHAGRYVVVRVSDEDPALLTRFERVGLLPGLTVHISTSGLVTAEPGEHVDLSERERQRVWLVPSAAG